jgi:hypothetical protein
VKLLPNDRALQTDLVRADWIVPIASFAGNRDPSASPPAQYTAAQVAEAADPGQHRLDGIYWAVWLFGIHKSIALFPLKLGYRAFAVPGQKGACEST